MINRDMADLKSILQNAGEAFIGMGESISEGTRAREAAAKALSNPLLEDVTINGARKILVTIFGGTNVAIGEIEEAMDEIHSRVSKDAHIFYGQVFDPDLRGMLRISVVATDFAGHVDEVVKGVQLSEEEYWKQPAFKVWKTRKLT
jgi:cell division protein FtsZ